MSSYPGMRGMGYLKLSKKKHSICYCYRNCYATHQQEWRYITLSDQAYRIALF